MISGFYLLTDFFGAYNRTDWNPVAKSFCNGDDIRNNPEC
jgi:hypothetical protein